MVALLRATGYLTMGVSVDVASLDEAGQAIVDDFPVKVHALGPRYLGKYGYSRRLGSWLAKNHQNYDCVIVDGLWQHHGNAARYALRKTNTPYVVFTHGMLDPWFKHH